jgi:hypothetical protein
MPIPEKLTVRLGDLRQPLEAWCTEHGQSPSNAARQAIATLLGVEPPEIIHGNMDIAKHSAEGGRAKGKKTKLAGE